MPKLRITLVCGISLILFAVVTAPFVFSAIPNVQGLRDEAYKELKAGNFKDAYKLFRKITLDPDAGTCSRWSRPSGFFIGPRNDRV